MLSRNCRRDWLGWTNLKETANNLDQIAHEEFEGLIDQEIAPLIDEEMLPVINRAAQGDLTQRVPVEGNEAIGELAAGSEEMASSSEELGSQAAVLRDLVVRFQL